MKPPVLWTVILHLKNNKGKTHSTVLPCYYWIVKPYLPFVTAEVHTSIANRTQIVILFLLVYLLPGSLFAVQSEYLLHQYRINDSIQTIMRIKKMYTSNDLSFVFPYLMTNLCQLTSRKFLICSKITFFLSFVLNSKIIGANSFVHQFPCSHLYLNSETIQRALMCSHKSVCVRKKNIVLIIKKFISISII